MATFRPKKIFITLDQPEEAEHFLRGLIIARQNNSSEYFQQLIEAVNLVMEPYRMAVLNEIENPPAPRVKRRVSTG